MLLSLLTTAAFAKSAAVAPFLAWGIDEKAARNLSAQMAQELDFLGIYDGVDALDVPPPGLNAPCLANPSCLSGLAAVIEVDHLLVGQVSGSAETYDVYAVLFDAGTGAIVRQHRFQISAASLADELPGQARFIATGEQAGAAPPAASASDFGEEEDFDFAPTPAPERTREPETIEIPSTAMDLSDVLEEEGEDAPISEPEPARERTKSRPTVALPDEDEDASADADSIREAAFEMEVANPRASSRFSVTARVGYARYQDLNFLSWGGEFGIDALAPVRINIGLEAQSLPLPVEGSEDAFGVPQVEWRSILPFNVGAVYVFHTPSLSPYVGGDVTLTAYTSSFDTAPGLRLRGGFDYMIARNFGFNVNAAAGMWFGTDSEGKSISVEMNKMGFAPQLSLGTVLAF